MAEPRYGHTAEELRHVADVVEMLNKELQHSDVGWEGSLTLYWADCVQGRVVFDRDSCLWTYEPEAQPNNKETH